MAALAAADHQTAAEIASAVRAMLAVLGLDPWAAPWVTSGENRRLVEATEGDVVLVKAPAHRDIGNDDLQASGREQRAHEAEEFV